MSLLDEDIRNMIFNGDYYYGFFLSQLNRRYEDDPKKCPTAMVQLQESCTTLVVNPKFWSAHNSTERAAFLKHEVAHFILEHIPLVKTFKQNVSPEMFNVAADLAVNSLIPEFPHKIKVYDEQGTEHVTETATVENLSKEFPGLEKGKSFFWYLEFLQRQMKQFGQGQYKFDSHDQWGEGIPDDAKEQIVKGLVQKALDESSRVSSGDKMSAELRKLLNKLLRPHNQWARELRRFPQDAEAVSLESTRKRVNKRYGTVYPGFKKERKVRIGVGFDVSGSMWDDATMSRLNAELCNIFNAGAELHVMFFDTAVVKEQDWEPKLVCQEIPGGGGTLFQPVLDRATELRLDGLIMLTDGANFDQITKPKFPVLWGILEEYSYEAPFGKVIKIPCGEERNE